jgi:hypothetical protein
LTRNPAAETKHADFGENVWWDPAGDPAALERPDGFSSFASASSARTAAMVNTPLKRFRTHSDIAHYRQLERVGFLELLGPEMGYRLAP